MEGETEGNRGDRAAENGESAPGSQLLVLPPHDEAGESPQEKGDDRGIDRGGPSPVDECGEDPRDIPATPAEYPTRRCIAVNGRYNQRFTQDGRRRATGSGSNST